MVIPPHQQDPIACAPGGRFRRFRGQHSADHRGTMAWAALWIYTGPQLVSLYSVISGTAFWRCHIDWWVFSKRDINSVSPRGVLFVWSDGIALQIERQHFVHAARLQIGNSFLNRHHLFDFLHLGGYFQWQDALG
jgi:hypothetical protein